MLGKAESIQLADRTAVEREVWAREAVATAAIEGETLDLGAVRSSVARAHFWSDHRDVQVNAEQRKVLNRMLDAGPGRFEGAGGRSTRYDLNIPGWDCQPTRRADQS